MATMEIAINLLNKGSSKTYPHDSIIINEGVLGKQIYILIDGKIEVTKNNKFITHINDGGSILGEISMLLGLPYTATCRSVGETHLYEIEITPRFLEDNPKLLLMIARDLARKLHKATSALASSNNDLSNTDQQFSGKKIEDIYAIIAELY